jgi:hypothetical protein
MLKNVAHLAAAVFVVMLFGSHIQAETIRHFRARVDLVQTGPPAADARCPAGTVLVSFTGSGNVTRAGRVSVEASHCIVDDPAVEPFTDGEMILSSTRGDLFIEYSGNDAAGDVTGTFVITGGTGDFAGASGGGTLRARAGVGGGRGVLEGTISVP